MTILITGATGQLGALVVDALLETVPVEDVAVSVRDPGKAEHLRELGVDVRQADFDDPVSLDRAFADVDRLLIISTDGDSETRIRQHRAAVDAAKRAGVKFLAYTSGPKADASPIGLLRVHRVTEEAIRSVGIPFCFLRNNWYTENEAGTIGGAAAGHPVLTSAGEGRVGWAARNDYAVAAAAVLAGDGHENRVYELAGPPRTYEEFARAIGSVLGREVAVQQVDDPAYGEFLSGLGLPEWMVETFTDVQRGIREGALDVERGDLETLLGRAVTPLEENIRGILKNVEA